MRGFASGPRLSPHFFIVMDRLYETIDVRMKEWADRDSKNRGGIFGRGANKLGLQELLLERLVVAYDLSTAFRYMHQNKCVEGFVCMLRFYMLLSQFSSQFSFCCSLRSTIAP